MYTIAKKAAAEAKSCTQSRPAKAGLQPKDIIFAQCRTQSLRIFSIPKMSISLYDVFFKKNCIKQKVSKGFYGFWLEPVPQTFLAFWVFMHEFRGWSLLLQIVLRKTHGYHAKHDKRAEEANKAGQKY